MKKTSCNFTVIELLIVITMICLIAGILMPALTQTLDRAKLTACSNNLRHIGQSVHWYCSDNSGYIPNIIPGLEDRSTAALRLSNKMPAALGRLINIYIENAWFFGCPDSPGYREEEVANSWSINNLVLSAYLYRGLCSNFKNKLHAPGNFRKPYVMDLAFISDQGEKVAPHGYMAVNILYLDCHVQSHGNTREPFKYFTAYSASYSEFMPDCAKLWQNADRLGKNR